MTIDLTNREIELLMGCIGTNIETVKRRHDPADPMIAELIEELFELETDLREALHRPDDFGLVAVAAEHDRAGEVFMVAEDDFIQRGMDAREKAKASSRAADRRNFNLKGRDKKLSAQQKHDVWDASDPRNW